MKDEYLAPREAAAYLCVSMQSLAIWRASKRGPKFERLPSRRVRYRREWLDAFLAECVIEPAATKAA